MKTGNEQRQAEAWMYECVLALCIGKSQYREQFRTPCQAEPEAIWHLTGQYLLYFIFYALPQLQI